MNDRTATQQDLPALQTMFADIVEEMRKNGVSIWNDHYPYEEFAGDIEKQALSLLIADKTELVAAFALFDAVDGQDHFAWQDKNAKAVHLARLGVNVAYQRQKIGALALTSAAELAKQKGATFLRLLVSDANLPAIAFYKKHGFRQAAGTYIEFSPSLNKDIVELGFERPIM